LALNRSGGVDGFPVETIRALLVSKEPAFYPVSARQLTRCAADALSAFFAARFDDASNSELDALGHIALFLL